MRLLVCDDIMTSSERKELRYKRRREKRDLKINRRCELYSNINNAFRFSKVMYYADKCCNGVSGKNQLCILCYMNLL